MNKETIYDGKTYVAVAVPKVGCGGCAFNDLGAHALYFTMGVPRG